MGALGAGSKLFGVAQPLKVIGGFQSRLFSFLFFRKLWIYFAMENL